MIGISADDPAPALQDQVRLLLSGLVPLLGVSPDTLASAAIEVDDGWVGGGYGVPTAESREAIELTARTEGLFLDPTYTAKAMAALIGRVRGRQFGDGQTVLFWHTGGQPALFA